MTTTAEARQAARDKAEAALTAYRRAEIRHRYGQATVADIEARRAEYQAALAELATFAEEAS